MNLIEQRRRQRQAIDSAENVITEVDRQMRKDPRRDSPPMEATRAQLAANPQQAITLNVEWVHEALDHTRADGWRSCLAVFQSLVDYANKHPEGYRNAFDEVVTDPDLRAILRDALDAL